MHVWRRNRPTARSCLVPLLLRITCELVLSTVAPICRMVLFKPRYLACIVTCWCHCCEPAMATGRVDVLTITTLKSWGARLARRIFFLRNNNFDHSLEMNTYIFISNLPYYITNIFILKFSSNKHKWHSDPHVCFIFPNGATSRLCLFQLRSNAPANLYKTSFCKWI